MLILHVPISALNKIEFKHEHVEHLEKLNSLQIYFD